MTSAHRDLAARAAEGIRPTSPTSTPRRRRSTVRTSEAAASDPDPHHRKGAVRLGWSAGSSQVAPPPPSREPAPASPAVPPVAARWGGRWEGCRPPDLGSPVAAREGDAGDRRQVQSMKVVPRVLMPLEPLHSNLSLPPRSSNIEVKIRRHAAGSKITIVHAITSVCKITSTQGP